jgi:hypothetical protein
MGAADSLGAGVNLVSRANKAVYPFPYLTDDVKVVIILLSVFFIIKFVINFIRKRAFSLNSVTTVQELRSRCVKEALWVMSVIALGASLLHLVIWYENEAWRLYDICAITLMLCVTVYFVGNLIKNRISGGHDKILNCVEKAIVEAIWIYLFLYNVCGVASNFVDMCLTYAGVNSRCIASITLDTFIKSLYIDNFVWLIIIVARTAFIILKYCTLKKQLNRQS